MFVVVAFNNDVLIHLEGYRKEHDCIKINSTIYSTIYFYLLKVIYSNIFIDCCSVPIGAPMTSAFFTVFGAPLKNLRATDIAKSSGRERFLPFAVSAGNQDTTFVQPASTRGARAYFHTL